MACEEILDLILSGDPDAVHRPKVDAHLKTCARCRDEASGLLAAVHVIRQASPSALGGHLSAEQIVAVALDPESAGPEPDPLLTGHATACPTCTAEIEEVRRAENARLSPSKEEEAGLRAALIRAWNYLRSQFARPSPAAKVAFAISLCVLVLIYPAYLGLHRLPLVERKALNLKLRANQLEKEKADLGTSLDETKRTVSNLGSWTGPLHWFLLASTTRGQAPRQTILTVPNEPYVLLAVRPILAEPVTDRDVYHVVISGADGRTAWALDLTVGEIRQTLRSSGALVFPVPAILLPPGRYELRVLARSDPHESILQIPFELESAR